MNITKWSALQAGLFLAAKRLVRILTSFTTLGILGSALYGLLHGFWLMTAPPMTAPFWLVWPLTSPLWWMWTTRVMLQRVYEPHKATDEDVRTEAVQTAAMALRLLFSLDRYEYKPCAQHAQTLNSSCGSE